MQIARIQPIAVFVSQPITAIGQRHHHVPQAIQVSIDRAFADTEARGQFLARQLLSQMQETENFRETQGQCVVRVDSHETTLMNVSRDSKAHH
ncbi:hypothetical protein D9M72_548630 [compost metagenome]